jgi:hypothetical protein
MDTIKYELDTAAWAVEQARLIRAHRFDLLDIEHIAEEIEDLSKSERRELMSRLVVLLSHLLKWKYQPDFRGNSWKHTIRTQRRDLNDHINENPSLRPSLTDPQWFEHAWDKALDQVSRETGMEISLLPSICPWSIGEITNAEWLP